MPKVELKRKKIDIELVKFYPKATESDLIQAETKNSMADAPFSSKERSIICTLLELILLVLILSKKYTIMTKITEKNKRMGINSLIYILIFIPESLNNFGFIKLENRKYLKCVLLSVKCKLCSGH